MDSMLWSLRTRDAFTFAWPVLGLLFFFAFVSYLDYPLLLFGFLIQRARGVIDGFVPRGPGERPSVLVIVPSLLRNHEDYTAITTTVESCATNEYPGELVIVASVDGTNDDPKLYSKLLAWHEALRHPSNVRVVIAGTPGRAGKMMAVEAGIQRIERMVAAGELGLFPLIYFSVDGDGVLGERALERMVDRLTTPHRLTGRPRRVVAGKCYINPSAFWQGWTRASLRDFFTENGQIYRQVGREFLVSNIPRFNLRPKPQVTIPGGLYCTWSEILRMAPRYMGFMRTIRFRDWLRWWVGRGPPLFSHSRAPPLPEALTGPSDDTCISFLAQMANWKDGHLSLDAPATPLHALGRMLRAYFLERNPGYAPDARVLTYTPPTIKGLWSQRVRWNSSRFECSYRFKNAFAFHWEVAFPMSFHWLLLSTFAQASIYYVLLPYHLLGVQSALFAFLFGYVTQMLVTFTFTLFALLLERTRRHFWPTLFAIPLSPLYSMCINFFAAIVGLAKDFFLFGNTTKFAPEWTLEKGKTVRLALLFRIRRFLALCVRAVVAGDVPFGSFWFGWRETPWTPNGYEGWTTGKRRAIVPPVSTWFRRRVISRDGSS